MPPIITEVWNAFLVHPLINLLVLADYFVHDFGLAVVIVTVAIRLALFPVFRAQVRSSRAMQELAPAMNDIKKKHGNDRAKLQQEQMKLYKERGINPVGGCLPMVVFFPVLFAMYAAFQQVGGLSGAHALTVEQLRDAVLWPFLHFTVSDLPSDATIDLTAHWLPWVSSLAQPDLLFFGFIGPLPRFIPPLANIPTPADKTMRARERAAIVEAEQDMEEPLAMAASGRNASGGGGRRRGRRRKR